MTPFTIAWLLFRSGATVLFRESVFGTGPTDGWSSLQVSCLSEAISVLVRSAQRALWEHQWAMHPNSTAVSSKRNGVCIWIMFLPCMLQVLWSAWSFLGWAPFVCFFPAWTAERLWSINFLQQCCGWWPPWIQRICPQMPNPDVKGAREFLANLKISIFICLFLPKRILRLAPWRFRRKVQPRNRWLTSVRQCFCSAVKELTVNGTFGRRKGHEQFVFAHPLVELEEKRSKGWFVAPIHTLITGTVVFHTKSFDKSLTDLNIFSRL